MYAPRLIKLYYNVCLHRKESNLHPLHVTRILLQKYNVIDRYILCVLTKMAYTFYNI